MRKKKFRIQEESQDLGKRDPEFKVRILRLKSGFHPNPLLCTSFDIYIFLIKCAGRKSNSGSFTSHMWGAVSVGVKLPAADRELRKASSYLSEEMFLCIPTAATVSPALCLCCNWSDQWHLLPPLISAHRQTPTHSTQQTNRGTRTHTHEHTHATIFLYVKQTCIL